jgi:uncharacterized membrane protein
MKKSNLPSDILFYLATRFWIIVALPTPFHSDVQHYLQIAQTVAEGKIPYRDFVLEYPPLALVFFLLPMLASFFHPRDLWLVYPLAFRFEMLLADGLLFVFVRRLTIENGRPNAVLYYILLTSFLSYFLLDRFDIVVALCIFASLLPSQTSLLSGFSIGLGVLTKLVPILVLPAVLINSMKSQFRRTQIIYQLSGAIIFPIFVFLILALCWGKEGVSFLTFHLHRGIQIESTWASLLLLMESGKLNAVENFGAIHLEGPAASALIPFTFWVTLFFVVGTTAISARAYHRRGQGAILMAHTSVLAFILTNKVFSPQFLIWLAPLVPFAMMQLRPKLQPIFGILMALAFASTALIYRFYDDLIQMTSQAIGILCCRNVLLFLALGLCLFDQIQMSQIDRPDSEKYR